MLKCKDAAIALSKSLDGELGPGEAWRLRFHLLICRSCSRLRRQLTLMRRLVAHSGEAEEEARLRDDARNRIREELRERNRP